MPRAGRDAELIIIHMRKSGKAALRLESPLCLHEGVKHLADCNDYTNKVEDILRGRGELTSWIKIINLMQEIFKNFSLKKVRR